MKKLYNNIIKKIKTIFYKLVGGQFNKNKNESENILTDKTINEEFDKWYNLFMAHSENLQKGGKAEYLTQVYLTSLAFSNPTYRQEDYGIDFTCTLIDKEGVKLYPTDVFAVQVKSHKEDKDQFITFTKKEEKDLTWLYNNQIPYFLAWVDMENTKNMYLYSISPIWYLEVLRNRLYKNIILEYDTNVDDNLNTSGFEYYKHDNDTYYFKLGKPFMTFTLEDLKSDEKIEEKKEILKKTIKRERENIVYRNFKLPLMRWLHEYKTNESNSFKFGWAHFSDKEDYKTINNPQNILTHIGQLIITLASSYELHKNDPINGKKYLEHHNALRKIIADIPFEDFECEGEKYEYKSYLKTLGYFTDDGKPILDLKLTDE